MNILLIGWNISKAVLCLMELASDQPSASELISQAVKAVNIWNSGDKKFHLSEIWHELACLLAVML